MARPGGELGSADPIPVLFSTTAHLFIPPPDSLSPFLPRASV